MGHVRENLLRGCEVFERRHSISYTLLGGTREFQSAMTLTA